MSHTFLFLFGSFGNFQCLSFQNDRLNPKIGFHRKPKNKQISSESQKKNMGKPKMHRNGFPAAETHAWFRLFSDSRTKHHKTQRLLYSRKVCVLTVLWQKNLENCWACNMRLIGSRKLEESEDIASFTDLNSHFSCRFCVIAKISQISTIYANLPWLSSEDQHFANLVKRCVWK